LLIAISFNGHILAGEFIAALRQQVEIGRENIGVSRLSADGRVNGNSTRGCSRFAVRSAGVFELHFACVARRATATGGRKLILSVVPAAFTGRLPIKGSWVEINRDE
jgi:hypothetical protein